MYGHTLTSMHQHGSRLKRIFVSHLKTLRARALLPHPFPEPVFQHSEQPCQDPRPQQRGALTETPPLTKSDLVELRVRAHRNEMLAVVWSDAAWANRKDLPVLNCWFLLRSYDNANLARRLAWCDADSSSFLKIEA